MSGSGKINVISNNVNLFSTIQNDMKVNITQTGQLKVGDSADDTKIGTLYINSGDTWNGGVVLYKDSTLYYKDLTENGKLNDAEANIYISGNNTILNLGNSSNIADASYISLASASKLNVKGGTLTINENDDILGTISQTSGNINVYNVNGNGNINSNGGYFRVFEGNVDLHSDSYIYKNTLLTLYAGTSITLVDGGVLDISSNDAFNGTVYANKGQINLIDRNDTSSYCILPQSIIISDANISNVDLTMENSVIDLSTNSTFDKTNVGNLIVKDDISMLKIGLDYKNQQNDSIYVGNSSEGTLILDFDINTSQISLSNTKDFTVLYRDALLNGAYNDDLQLVLSENVTRNNKEWTVESYIDTSQSDRPYVLTDESFIGLFGIGIVNYDSYSDVRIGSVYQTDPLVATNQYSNSLKRRIFKLQNAFVYYTGEEPFTFNENFDLGETGAGIFIVGGKDAENSIINMTEHSGFVLNQATDLTIQDITLKNSSELLKLNNQNASATISNAILEDNIVAIRNLNGLVTISNSSIKSGTNSCPNSIVNNWIINIDSSTIESVISNNSTLNLLNANIYGNITDSGNIKIQTGTTNIYSTISNTQNASLADDNFKHNKTYNQPRNDTDINNQLCDH